MYFEIIKIILRILIIPGFQNTVYTLTYDISDENLKSCLKFENSLIAVFIFYPALSRLVFDLSRFLLFKI